MKVLVACIPTPGNRYLTDLVEGLENQGIDVHWDYKKFWSRNEDFDVIHIHWPEYLSYELESYLRSDEKFSVQLWEKITSSLGYWEKKSKIIYTRHNQYPHSRSDDDFLRLYREVVFYASAIVHFANYSISQFKNLYPDIDKFHFVVPHHNYKSLPNKLDKNVARQRLGIRPEAIVMLVFGTIKESEKKLITKAFSQIRGAHKVLIAPGWMIKRRKIGYIRLREWVYSFEVFLASWNRKKRINIGFVKEDEVGLYINASNFMFIPRQTELNSGNIALACTFARVVVGINNSNIGEVLDLIGNPSYKKGDFDSLGKAINEAIQLDIDNNGLDNEKIAVEQWSVEEISKSYLDIFSKLQKV